MTVDATSVTSEVPKAAREFERFGDQAAQASAKVTKSVADVSLSVRDMVAGAAGIHILATAIGAVTSAITALPRQAFDYSKELEVSQIGMAGILGSMTAINGRQTDYNRALGISREMIGKLNDDALRTAASSQELVAVFQALLAPGLAARMDLEQIRQLTVVGTNAVKSMGLDATQVVQELRDLVSGGITPASSTLATALGLKDSDIQKAKSSSEGLFSFLMERLKGFEASSEAFGDTLKGKIDQLKEGAVRVAAEGLQPLTDAAKVATGEIASLFVTVDASKNVTLNKELVQGIREYAEGAVTAIGVGKDLVASAWAHREAVMAVAAAYGAVKLGVWANEARVATVAKLEAAQASRLAAVQAAAEGTANAAASVSTRQKVAALLAEVEAQRAIAQAQVSANVARLATLNSTLEAIALTRSEVVAKLEATRATLSQAEAQISAARAAGAQSFALALLREGTDSLAAAQVRHAALTNELASLGRQQASVNAAVTATTVAQTGAITAATSAQERLAAAKGAATSASRGLGAVVGALGGPFGIAIAAAGLLAFKFYEVRDAAEAAEKAQFGVQRGRQALASSQTPQDRDTTAARRELERWKDIRDEMERTGKQEITQTRWNGIVPTTVQIASMAQARYEIAMLEGQLKLTEFQASKSTVAAALTLTPTAALQAFEKTVDGAKTASAAQEEYTTKVNAARIALDALKASGASPEVYKKAQADFNESDAAWAAERDKKIKAMTAGSAAAVTDGLNAQVKAFKNADEKILDDKKNFATALDLQVQLRQKSELGALQETLQEEDRVWALRKANFAGELAEAAKKKNSLNEQQTITGKMEDAERSYLQSRKKTENEIILLVDRRRLATELAYEADREASSREIADDYVAQSKARELGRQVTQDYARAVTEGNAATQFELTLMGMTERNRAIAIEQYRIQVELKRRLAAIDSNSGFDESQRVEERTRATEAAAQESAGVVDRVTLDEWKKTTASMNTSLTDALLRGAESGKGIFQNLRDTLKNMFSTLVLRPVISAVMAPVSGMVSGAINGLTGGSAGGASSALSWLTDFGGSADTAIYKLGGSLFKNGLESLGGTLLDNSAAIGQGLETLGQGLGYLNSILALKDGKYGQAAGAAIGTYFGGPIGSAIGSAIGKYIDKAFAGETRVGGQFAVAYNDQVVNNRRGQTYTYEGQQYDRDFSNGARNRLTNGQAYRLEGDPVSGGQDAAIRQAIAGTATGIGDMLKALGSKVTVTGFWAGLETSEKGRGGVFAGGALSNGAAFGESGKGDNYKGTLYEKFSSNIPDFKAALENFTLDLKQSAIQALQSVGDIPESIKAKLSGVDAEGLTDAAADALLTAINVQIAGVTQFKSALGAMGMDKFAALSFDAAAGIGELSGGFDKLQTNLGSYYENFYSAEERRTNLKKQVTSQLAELNLELPDINAKDARAQYRALIDKQDPETEAGKKAIALLLSLSGAVASITPAAEEATDSIQKQEALKKSARAQEIQVLELLGDSEGALAARRADELAAMDPALRAKQQYIYQLQDEAKSTQALAALKQRDRAQDIEVMELLGDSQGALAARRADELAEMDPTLRAKQQYIYQLQDEAKAAEKLAAIKQRNRTQDIEILELQGKSEEALAAKRADELAAMDPALRAKQQYIYQLQDEKKATDQARQAAEQAAAANRTATDDAYALLQRSVDAQKANAQAAQEAAQGIADAARSVIDALRSGIADLTGDVGSAVASNAVAGQAFIDQALSAARRTGYLPDSTQLSNAIGAARDGMGATQYASRVDMDRDRLVLAGKLTALRDMSEGQLTVAEQGVKASKDQIKALDDLLVSQRKIIDAARGIDVSVVDVTAAITKLHQAIFKETGVNPGATTPAGNGAVVGAGPGGSSAPVTSALGKQANGSYIFSDGYVSRVIAGADAARLDAAAGIVAQYNGTGDVKGYYSAMRDAGYTLRDIAARDGYFYGDVLNAAAAAGLPAFKNGGNHLGGARLVGEEGPEIEVTGPSRIFSAADTRRMLSGGDGGSAAAVEASIRALQSTVRELRDQNYQMHRQMVVALNEIRRIAKETSVVGQKVVPADKTGKVLDAMPVKAMA
ncbi:hypothetical protein ACFX58_03445 [Sphingomonas sp. NCPPB 2930]